MYEAFFGLTKRPFASVPCADQYYPAGTVEAARQTLVRCIQRTEGPAMLVGPSGTGKTLLCQVLAERFKGQFEVVLVTGGGLSTRRALLQAILYGLGQPYRGMDEGELRLALVDHFTGGRQVRQECVPSSAGMLLLVDEAHTLPLRLLDEVRMIASLAHGGQARTRLVLAGGPVLEERLASPKLESFSQRLVARCYLEAFNRCETESYIHTQLDEAGGRGSGIFPPESCHAVYQATDGVPRLVNHLCDHVLLMAMAAGKSVVLPEHVEEAWADLQQLPTPWNGERAGVRGQGPGARGQGAVEFGELTDEAEDRGQGAGCKGQGPGARGQGAVEFGALADEPEEAGAAGPPATAAEAVSPAAPTPETDCALVPDAMSPEPAEQLQRIETLIGRLQEEPQDFQPAGSPGPEVEVVIEDFGNPFGEPFQEEEIVVDRFAAAMESRPCARQQDGGTRDEGGGTRDEARGMGDEGRGTRDGRRGMRDEEPRAACSATVVLERPGAAPALAWAEARQDEVIPEDGREEPPPRERSWIAPVRGPKFGQLFARLQSGGTRVQR